MRTKLIVGNKSYIGKVYIFPRANFIIFINGRNVWYIPVDWIINQSNGQIIINN